MDRCHNKETLGHAEFGRRSTDANSLPQRQADDGDSEHFGVRRAGVSHHS